MRGPQVAAGVLTPPPVPDPDDDATRFIEPEAIKQTTPDPDPEATRFEPIDPVDPEATGFVDTDVTRLASAPGRSHLESPPTPRPTTRLGAGTRRGTRATGGETGPLDVGQAFGERYHIIRVLGIGGMGAVYHAWDAELGMAVALKVIRPDAGSDPNAALEMERRFKQELVLARQVTHKNVVRIHDLGEIDGIKYITMPYLEGSDLSTVLKETGKMPVPKALAIIRDVAAGLVAAHEVGIVHRDLKPANIMVLKDHAVIMDFGIARSNQLPQDASAHLAPTEALDSLKSAAAKTVVGTILGTVQYMAPEQAKLLDVDQRADVYALGLIFLDMLLGKRHTHASSAIDELKARIEQPPPLAQTLDPTIPKAIEQIIARCVEPDREKRFRTSAELVAALDRLDDKGEPIPIKRTVRLPYAVAAAVLLLAISVGVWWYQRQFIPPTQHDPVVVVIADFVNRTGDPTFDNTLTQTLRRGLEDASFITAYDRTGVATLGVRPVPTRLDESAARQLAVNQGLGIVLAGTIGSQGSGYDITVKVLQALNGEAITAEDRHATSKDQVLATLTRMVADIRSALGDSSANSAQARATMRSLSTTSLDVASQYGAAVAAQSQGKYEDAFRNFERTVQLDPHFGLGYQGMAAMARNQGRLQDAEKYAKEALKYLDGMTERERFQTRGNYAIRTGDYKQCVQQFEQMLAKYPADVVGHVQRANCLASLRDWPGAVNELKQVSQILPNHITVRANLVVYLDYAGKFVEAEQEIQKVAKPDARIIGAQAFSLLGQERVQEAAEAYKKLAATGAFGTSFAAAGLADLSLYQGRFAEAIKLFEEGAAADLAAKNRDAAAMKFTSLAYAHLMKDNRAAAAAAARRALDNSTVAPIRFLSARIFAETGDLPRARAIAEAFAAEVGDEHRAYAKIIEANIELRRNPQRAIDLLNEANGMLDTWLGRFDLGRAYMQAKGFFQAEAEFDRCIQHRGEALALVQEDPTYGQLPLAYYYLGRAREEIGTVRFDDSYGKYLEIRGQSTDDPLVSEVRRRMSK